MEPAGLAIGVIGLTSLFSTCIECFDYIQLARSFGGDYGKCLLRLDAAKVQLSRWGKALGITARSQGVSPITISQADFILAQNLLQQIHDTFEDAERVSKRYEKYAELQNPASGSLLVCDEQTDLSERDSRLHSHLRAVASRRQESTGILRKARWALYERKKFNQLIADITEFVDKLVTLFPTAKEPQLLLCKTEISEIREEEDLVALQTVAGPDDAILRSIIEAEQARRGHVATNWKAGENTEFWIGDENDYGVESKGHHASEFTISGSAKVRLGNKNKGKLSVDGQL